MEADGAIPLRSLISLLWASSTLSSSEVKGHTKYISECHLRGGKKREEMITPGLLTNLCRTELADSISVSEPRALGDSRRDCSSREKQRLHVGDSFVFALI